VEPVVAVGAVHCQVRYVVASPHFQELVYSLSIGGDSARRKHRAQQLQQRKKDQRVTDHR
jgi:hypothetical protein